MLDNYLSEYGDCFGRGEPAEDLSVLQYLGASKSCQDYHAAALLLASRIWVTGEARAVPSVVKHPPCIHGESK